MLAWRALQTVVLASALPHRESKVCDSEAFQFCDHTPILPHFIGSIDEGLSLLSTKHEILIGSEGQMPGEGLSLLSTKHEIRLEQALVQDELRLKGHGDVCSGDVNIESLFKAFLEEHSRDYAVGSTEYEERLKLFEGRVNRIRQLNCRPGITWRAAINKFADRSDEELSRLRGYIRGDGAGAVPPTFLQTAMADSSEQAGPLPKSTDWRNLSAMLDVKTQGDCGSCWAFAATTALAAHSELHGVKRSYSPQHLVQCVENPRHCGGTGGCSGATVELAMEHVVNRGLATSEELPYHGASPVPPCPGTSQEYISGDAGLMGFKKLPENEEEPVLRALQDGPLTAAIMATDSWYDYAGGVHDSHDCPLNATVNHAVTLVGYGEEMIHSKLHKYWLIQNSWGKSWGEGGFIRIKRQHNEGRRCGWDNLPLEGNGCEGGPDKMYVCGTCGVLSDTVRPLFRKRVSPIVLQMSSLTPF